MLVVAQSERGGDAVDDLRRGMHVLSLLESRVPAVTQGGEVGDLLAPEAGHAAAPAVGEPDQLRKERLRELLDPPHPPIAFRPQQLDDLGFRALACLLDLGRRTRGLVPRHEALSTTDVPDCLQQHLDCRVLHHEGEPLKGVRRAGPRATLSVSVP